MKMKIKVTSESTTGVLVYREDVTHIPPVLAMIRLKQMKDAASGPLQFRIEVTEDGAEIQGIIPDSATQRVEPVFGQN